MALQTKPFPLHRKLANTMKTPAVLQVGKYYPPHPGGIEIHLESLSEALHRKLDLRVVVCGDSARAVSEVRSGVRIERAGRWVEMASTALCPSMIRMIRRNPSAIIHLHLPNPMGCLAYLASKHTGKLVVTYHSDVIRQKILGKGFQPVLDKVLDRSSAIIVSTREYLESSSVLRRYRDKCRVIPFGIDLAPFRDCDLGAVERIQAKFGDRIVLAVGRLVYYKGFEYLIRAMQTSSGRLLLIGDGPLRMTLERLVRSLRLEGRVHFLGRLTDGQKMPYYRAAKVFALPSIARSESFGIVQIEAMAAGTPVINTWLNSGVPAVSLHGVTGLTVPPKDPAALANAINKLLDDPFTRERLASAALARAEREFSLPAMLERTLRVYDEVLGKRLVPEQALAAAAR